MKKHTENILSSCSILPVKTVFHFILQRISVSYLESGLCKLGKKLGRYNFTYAYPRNRPFYLRNHNACKYKTLGFIGLFSLHIEPPVLSMVLAKLERNMRASPPTGQISRDSKK